MASTRVGDKLQETRWVSSRRQVTASYPTSPSHLGHFALRPRPGQPVVVAPPTFDAREAEILMLAVGVPQFDRLRAMIPSPVAEQLPALALDLVLGGSFGSLLRSMVYRKR
jgi:hypothetical protein